MKEFLPVVVLFVTVVAVLELIFYAFRMIRETKNERLRARIKSLSKSLKWKDSVGIRRNRLLSHWPMLNRFLSHFPLVKKLLINPEILDTDKLYQRLAERNTRQAFEQRMAKAGYIVAASFFLSSVLNYILAKAIVVSQPGTTAYAEELGRMTWLSYPVIVLPSMVMLFGAIIYMFRQISALTGQALDDFILQ